MRQAAPTERKIGAPKSKTQKNALKNTANLFQNYGGPVRRIRLTIEKLTNDWPAVFFRMVVGITADQPKIKNDHPQSGRSYFELGVPITTDQLSFGRS